MPHSRRPRAILLGDEILAKVGGYVLGNVITSVIAGPTYFWMLAFGIPYPLLLGMFVALLDLIPVIGSTVVLLVPSERSWRSRSLRPSGCCCTRSPYADSIGAEPSQPAV